jgi:hypothetical protein
VSSCSAVAVFRLTGACGVAVAPPLAPHNLYNIGDETLRVIGFFPSGAVVARHDDRIEPLGTTDIVVPNPDDV